LRMISVASLAATFGLCTLPALAQVQDAPPWAMDL
jgi:hypothetical protein